MKTARIFFLLFIVHSSTFNTVFAQGPWTQKASMPGLARHRIFSFSIGSRGYIGCGWNGVDMYGDFWEYDPGSNSWSQKADYPPGPRLSAFGFAIGNKGYAGAGLDANLVSMSDCYSYSPTSNSWTSIASFGGSPRFGCAVAVLNNKGYVAMGDEWDPSYWRTDDVWMYDPANDTWNYETTIPADGRRDPNAFVLNNKIYMGLGSDNSYIENNDWWMYDPANGSWTQRANCGFIPRAQSTGFAVNGKGYIGLGQDQSGIDRHDFLEYDAALNLWRGINDFPGASRENSFAFVIGNHAYVTCGTSGINYNDCWEFDPAFITGEEQDGQVLTCSVFPDPVKDHFTLQLSCPPAPGCDLFIYDVNGKVVSASPITHRSSTIQRNDLPPGVYFFEVGTDQKKVASGKLIFQ